MKFILHHRLHRKQHIAINIVEQIQASQHDQRRAGIEIGRGHRSSEYNTVALSA